jgi:hypothetical protein
MFCACGYVCECVLVADGRVLWAIDYHPPCLGLVTYSHSHTRHALILPDFSITRLYYCQTLVLPRFSV